MGTRRQTVFLKKDDLPTRAEFNEQFNQTLSEIFPTLHAKVQGVKSTSELEERECHPRKRSYDADLIIVFDGDVENFNDDQLSVIEYAVRKAYNTMNAPNPYSCDTKFKKVKYANHIESTMMNDGTLVMAFSLKYQCRGCWKGEEPSLFDIYTEDSLDVGRQDLAVDFRELGPKEPECSCDKEAKFERAPTIDEFTNALQQTLGIRSQENKIPHINVLEVLEEDEDDDVEYCCSDDYKNCKDSDWCNESQSNCGTCNGHWMEVNSCGTSGVPRWGDCTNNGNCCSPATCTRKNRWYSQCL